MQLILGGFCQGKLQWYLEQSGRSLEEVSEGGALPADTIPTSPILNHLHLWIGRMLQEQISPLEQIQTYLTHHPDAVILCDEIGCGLVPISGFDRQWREEVGRICCILAKQADTVDRVFCGLPTRLKGEETSCRLR